jgi:hypothetical protein
MSFEVFTARRRISDLASAVYETVFYDAMDMVLTKGEWLSYVDAVNGKTVTFQSMNEFLTHPDGLAVTDLGLFQRCIKAVGSSTAQVADMAKRLLARLEELGMKDAPFTAEPLAAHGTNQHGAQEGEDVTTSPPLERGNGQAYLLKRLARDRPELLEQIGKGKAYPSVRAAAIEAGIVKDVPTVRLTEPDKAAMTIVARMGPEWAAHLSAALANAITTPAQP